MIYAGTGHRNPFGEYGRDDELIDFAKAILEKLSSTKFKPTKIISGMALGWDMALADAAVDLNIPFDAYIPFPKQYERWPKESQERWSNLTKKAEKVHTSCDKYTNFCMQKRNKDMVDNCEIVLALWSGENGGTKNCVDYAKKNDTRVINCWPDFSRIFIDSKGELKKLNPNAMLCPRKTL